MARGVLLSTPFLPVARSGRSTLVTVAHYSRHRMLFVAGAHRRRGERSGDRTVGRRTRAALYAFSRTMAATRCLLRHR